jgi:hypothetical protein
MPFDAFFDVDILLDSLMLRLRKATSRVRSSLSRQPSSS